MAEIKIEKKSTKWPWILLAIAVLALMIYLLSRNYNGEIEDQISEITPTESNDMRQEAPDNSTVAEFVTFIQDDPDSMGIHHEYTNEALLKLTNALNAMADEIGYDIRSDMEQVKTYADQITQDPFATTHANSIRKAADILAGVMQNMQQKAFPNLASEADGVKNAAAEIQVERLTLDQREEVKNYFRKSADLLEKMNMYPSEM